MVKVLEVIGSKNSILAEFGLTAEEFLKQSLLSASAFSNRRRATSGNVVFEMRNVRRNSSTNPKPTLRRLIR